MENYKLILFLCNWGANTAYQALQDQGYRVPPEINMVRIPCSGRISKALLFKTFEMGADGVALVGCQSGSCRYGVGTDSAVQYVEDTRDILTLLGLDSDRLQLATVLPDDVEELHRFIDTFYDKIHSLGKTPLIPTQKAPAPEMREGSLAEILATHNAYGCQECGKCTSSCSLALSGKPFSPRAIASAVIAGDMDSKEIKADVWSCLTCGFCHERCPSGVNFPEFIGDLRALVKSRDDGDAHQAHGGFFQSLMRAMTSPDVSTDRWCELPPDIKVDDKSNILFFGGCAPYFDTFFRHHLGVKTEEVLVDSLRLMNFFDITPAIMKHERCCGHDLLWSGDRENFRKLARLNVDQITGQGIEEVVTACPECYRTLALDYQRFGVETPFKVTHIYELLEQEIDKGAVTFTPQENPLTFQDSCRMNGFDKLKDLPRKLINRIPGGALTEMKDYKDVSMCCGSSAWTGCDAYSKAMQVKRLRQARETGSRLMVTACPKCQIHLQCAMEDSFLGHELKMELMDLTSLVQRTICWE